MAFFLRKEREKNKATECSSIKHSGINVASQLALISPIINLMCNFLRDLFLTIFSVAVRRQRPIEQVVQSPDE